jgi:hypothetical protein
MEGNPCSECKDLQRLLLAHREELYDLKLKYKSVISRLEKLEAVTGISSPNSGDIHQHSKTSSNDYNPSSSTFYGFKNESSNCALNNTSLKKIP